MKCKELMVGDLVTGLHRLPMKITNVDDDYAYAHTYGDIWNGCEFDDEDNPPMPIPLTTEILEKNGWYLGPSIKANDYIAPWLYKEDGIVVSLDFPTKQLPGLLAIFNERINRSMPEFLWKDALYVHELQHALRLCGLDELADNFKI